MNIILLEILVCLLLIDSTHAKESRRFDECRELFFKNSPPVLKYEQDYNTKSLCENYKNTYYFAAYYDTNKKLPLFSAFTLPEIIGKRRKWTKADNKRKWRSSSQDLILGEQIPFINDYKGIEANNLDRGHLATRSYFPTIEGRKAVDALTNIALQDKTFNQNTWAYLEQKTLDISREHCHIYGGQNFFITGVVPSDDHNFESKRNSSMKINIPSYFWTAVCCDTSRGDIRNSLKGWSYAYISANNYAAKSFDIMTVEEFLKDERIGLKYKPVSLFKEKVVMTDGFKFELVKNCLFNPDKATKIIEAIRKKTVLNPVRITGSVPYRRPFWFYWPFISKYSSYPFKKRSSNFKRD